MDYGKILKRAWEITWRWKILWILGFLAALGRGGGGSANYSFRFDSSDWSRWGYTYYGPVPPGIVALLVGLVCLAILIGIAIWVVTVIARGGLIAGVQQVEDEGTTTFGQAWRVGVKRFWTLFGLSILTALPFLILLVIGVGTLALLITSTVGTFDTSEAAGVVGIIASVLCGGTLCCGAILLGIVLDQIRIYAERAAILEGLGWIDAFKRGWEVLKNNLGPTIVFWVIFLVIGLIIGVTVLMAMGIISAPFMAIIGQARPGPWLIAPVCFGGLLGLIVFGLIGSIVETFSSATWTLAYRKMTGLAAQPVAEPIAE